MITLLASIAGFLGSLIPEIIKIVKDRNDKKHELNMFDLQIKSSKLNNSQIVEDNLMRKDILEQVALYSTYKSGITWVDALNASVRPVLAYSFFIMYGMVKFAQYRHITLTAPLVEYIDIIWSIDDQAIFAGIISFYYGQRTFSKAWKTK